MVLAGFREGLRLCWLAALGVSASAPGDEWDRERSHDRGSELVGFVQPERLYWRPFELPGVQSAEFKLLSFDESSGARTLLVRLPAGWNQEPGYHSADLEMFVAEGGVSMGGEATGRYSYAYYPAGHSHAYGTEFGATVLQMWSGKPDYVASAESRRGAQSGEAIEGWRYGDAPSTGPARFPEFRDEPFREDSPIRMKLMRHDEDSGEKTWIAVLPGGSPAVYGEGHLPPWASSTSWAEGFLLAGDMTIAECLPQGEVAGTYTEGGYLWIRGEPDFVPSKRHKRRARVHAAVRNWNHFDSPWYIGDPFPAYRVGGNFSGAVHKLLRQDADTGENTWMTFNASIPATSRGVGNFGGGYEVHPSFEEYYFLEKSGDTVIGECLEQGLTQITYGDRSYWWRPGGVGHGGATSHGDGRPDYNIAIVRTGTRLWADYFTDCSYETQIEYTGKGFRALDAKERD